MPSNKDLDEEQFEEFNKLSDVKKKTQDDRDRFYNYFYDFLEKSGFTEGKSLGEVLQTKEGRLKFSKLHYQQHVIVFDLLFGRNLHLI